MEKIKFAQVTRRITCVRERKFTLIEHANSSSFQSGILPTMGIAV